ncbi:MAG: ferritin family protein [Spirochaetales bacterium]|nr:ferritin family protein [Spirochaetales bacterium]
MGIQFNADEIFELAINIEKNGAAFYRKAAAQQDLPDNKQALIQLAGMEDQHQKTFEEMRQKLSTEEKTGSSYDPYDELSLYLVAAADLHGGEGSPDEASRLKGRESMKEIITIAMGLERKSILYYLGLKDLVSEKQGKEKIEDIITEEKTHLVQLSRLLNKNP